MDMGMQWRRVQFFAAPPLAQALAQARQRVYTVPMTLHGSVRFVCFAMIAAMLGTVAGADAWALGDKKKKMGGGPNKMAPSDDYAVFEAKGLFPTGLRAVFPKGLDCPPISSPYGSPTRYDGSARNNEHHGYHNGMDISLDPGTALLSVADGEVISVGSAGQLVGNFIWLHYAPEATGLPFHVFARYQHLDQESTLSIGARVKAGDVVGPAGKTGTVGGHYGSVGYPHLHLVFYTGPSAEYTVNGAMIGPKSLNYLDPLALYLKDKPTELSNHLLRDLPDGAKDIAVPAQTADGVRHPADAALVWPVACK